MKRIKKTAWTLTSVLLVFIFAITGCSGPGPGATEVAQPGDTDPEETIITFAAYEYQRQLFEPLIETFQEQNPGIVVQFVDLGQAFPYDEDWNIYKYLRNMAQAADTFIFQGSFELDLSRYFRELRPLVETDPTFNGDDFWPGILAACEDSYGNMIGLPISVSINGLFYDQAAFDAAGFPYPEMNWTVEDFQRTVVALSEQRGSQTKYGFYDQASLYGSILGSIVNSHLLSNSGEIDPAALEADVQWYIDLAKNGQLSAIKTEEDMQFDWEQREKLFRDDALRPAMWIDALVSYIPSDSMEFDPENPLSGMSIDRFGLAPLPAAAPGAPALASTANWVECASISAGSPNPRAAWAWLNFLSEHWLVVDKSQVYELSRTPARQSVADDSGYWDLLPEKVVPAMRYILGHSVYGFNYMEQLNWISTALANTIAKGIPLEQTIETARANIPPTPQAPEDESPIVVATPQAPLPEGVTAVKYFLSQYGPDELNTIKTLAEQFSQDSPEVQIIVYTEFYGNPMEDWIAAMAERFDCFITNAPQGQTFDTSAVLNLNAFMRDEPASFSGDFSKVMLDKFSLEGALFALPASTQLQMIAYNADLLARRGVQVPGNDWTFDEFITLASAAASTSSTDPSYGYMYGSYDDFISRGMGIEWADFDSNPPEINLNTPEMLEHLEWLANNVREHVFFDSETDWEKTDSLIMSGQLGFWTTMMGEEEMWFYGRDEEPGYKIGVLPFPSASNNSSITTWSNDRGHYISAQSQNPQACWDWIKFLTEQPNMFAGVPVRRSIAESPAWESIVGKEKSEAYRTALENLVPVEAANLELQNVIWPLNNWRSQVIRAALDGQELQPVLVSTQRKAQAYLDCALLIDTSQPYEQVDEAIRSCLLQADPEGTW